MRLCTWAQDHLGPTSEYDLGEKVFSHLPVGFGSTFPNFDRPGKNLLCFLMGLAFLTSCVGSKMGSFCFEKVVLQM